MWPKLETQSLNPGNTLCHITILRYPNSDEYLVYLDLASQYQYHIYILPHYSYKVYFNLIFSLTLFSKFAINYTLNQHCTIQIL